MEEAGPLRNVELFAGLSSSELVPLEAALRRRRFRRNEVICHRDDPGNSFFVISSGLVKVSLNSDDGREVILNLLGPGATFGELALLDGEPRSADVTAMEATELLVLPREVFLDYVTLN